MTDFRLTLTDGKPFALYLKKMLITGLILFVGLLFLQVLSKNFSIEAVILCLILSIAFAFRCFSHKIYINEPFFMITDNVVRYRISEYKKISEIKVSEIQNITLTDSSIVLTKRDYRKVKINLNFVSEKYTRDIRKYIILLAYDKKIILDRK